MTVICLDGSKNAFVVCRSFTRWFTRWRETHRNKKWAAGQNFYGEEKLGGWDFVGPGTSHYLPPRYKVCMIETERDFIFIFIFTFTFIYFCFFFSKGFNQTLMYCPKKKKRKERRKRKRTSSSSRMIVIDPSLTSKYLQETQISSIYIKKTKLLFTPLHSSSSTSQSFSHS